MYKFGRTVYADDNSGKTSDMMVEEAVALADKLIEKLDKGE